MSISKGEIVNKVTLINLFVSQQQVHNMLNFEMNEKHFPVYLLAGTKFHLSLRADGMLADNKSFVTLYAINIYGEIKN